MLDRRYWSVVSGTVLGLGLFIGWAAVGSGPGFPLDDAWIHQTYARNLAASGRWEYVPSATSAGSTAPLWTLLLAAGYLLRAPYFLWTYLWGGLTLLWLAWAGMRLWRNLWPEQANRDWLAGLALVFTWPLVWAAASGMETLLFAALGMTILALYTESASLRVSESASERVGESEATIQSPISSRWWDIGRWHIDRWNTGQSLVIGFLSGLLILTRPEGLVLLALVALGRSLWPATIAKRVKEVVILLGAAALPLLPYFIFNQWASGTLWPNTFYAKQTEYAALLWSPLWTRLGQLLFLSLGGPASGWRGMSSAHLLLLPGLVVAIWPAIKKEWAARRLCYVLPLLWAGGHVFLYAWRLPVTFQHGRYIMAAVPIWVLYGLAGWLLLLAGWRNGRLLWIGQRVTGFTFAGLLLIFWLLGAQAYASDVAFIEGEMVTVARWLAGNTSQDALVAAHDIGALGYFAQRPLLDLAGLITPEIIPLLADEAALAEYILASSADYLVTAPGWPYERIVENSSTALIYTTDFAWTQTQGLNNMSVYRLQSP